MKIFTLMVLATFGVLEALIGLGAKPSIALVVAVVAGLAAERGLAPAGEGDAADIG